MNEAAPDAAKPLNYPPGFRARRGLNWGFLGLLYTSFYMCRYNLSIANGSISREFGFTRADMGAIITTALLAYAFGQILNGLICDKIGGKRSMLIGAVGTIIMNILFGAASFTGHFAPAGDADGPGLYQARPSVEFVAEDFEDLKSLAAELDQGTNAAQEYLRSQLSPETRRLLHDAQGAERLPSDLAPALTGELNQLIHGPLIYDTNHFRGVTLSRGATNVLALAATGQEIVRMNRLTLDEAFPQEIRRSNYWLVHIPFFRTQLFISLLLLFVMIRGIDGYMQAYGAPGMIKINTAWFAQRERGRFAGIFGFMINLGRFGIFNLGPALLGGFVFLGMWHVPPLHWRWLFWAPSGVCAAVAIGMALTVKQTPEAAGFHGTAAADTDPVAVGPGPTLPELLMKMISHPTIWIVALAYACTGAVRQAIDQWFPRYMQDMFHMDMKSDQFQWLGFLIPFVASAGSLASGYISDTIFKGRRAPVALGIYFIETAIILLAAQFHTANAAVVFLILISLTANSTHSLLGTAAAMDIGGRKQAGLASGIIDSFQYFGGSLAGILLGWLLDKSLGNYFYFMAPFGFIGGVLMLFIMGRITPQGRTATVPPVPETVQK